MYNAGMTEPTGAPEVPAHLIEIAWAAGLYEGEGSCFINARGAISVTLGMSDLEPVSRFHQIVGVGTIYSYENKPPRKPVHRFVVTRCDEVIQVLTLLIDSGFLSPRRTEQAERVLNVARGMVPKSSGRRGYTEKEKEQFAILTRLGLRNG